MKTKQTEKSSKTKLEIFFWLFLVICCSFLATFRFYSFGKSDHLEHLPIVYRLLNPHYLVNDFYTNASAGIGPRFYSSQILAWLAGSLETIEINYFFLTLVLNSAIGLITYQFSRKILGQSERVSFFATLLVLFFPSFLFGYYDRPIIPYAIPAMLLSPVIYFCISLYLNGKYWLIAPIAVIASFLHPTLGLGSGLILVNLGIIYETVSFMGKPIKQWVPLFVKFISLNLLMGIAYLPYASNPSSGVLNSELFNLYVYYRVPHHLLASTFPADDFLKTFSFIAASLTGLFFLRSSLKNNPVFRRTLLLYGGLIALSITGWFLVEIIPLNIFATLFAFRYLMMLKWLGLILIGTLIFMNLWEFLINPPAYYKKSLSGFFTGRLSVAAIKMLGLLALSIWLYLEFQEIDLWIVGLVVVLFLMLLIFENSIPPIKILSGAVITVSLIALITLGAINSFTQSMGWLPEGLAAKITPKINIRQNYNTDMLAISDFIASNTPEDAVILTPPGYEFGYLRILSKRAMVCDIKAFPFQSNAQGEWQQRVFDCYGRTPNINYLSEMELNYKNLTDETTAIKTLQEKYYFDYAMLYADTETDFPVIFSSEEYKIIDVSNIK